MYGAQLWQSDMRESSSLLGWYQMTQVPAKLFFFLELHEHNSTAKPNGLSAINVNKYYWNEHWTVVAFVNVVFIFDQFVWFLTDLNVHLNNFLPTEAEMQRWGEE